MPVGHRRRRREACWTAASTAASSPQSVAMSQNPAPFIRGSSPPLTGSSAIGTLVERMTRFTLLLHLPRMTEHGHEARMKNGPALAGHGAEAVCDAITRTIITPEGRRWHPGVFLRSSQPVAARHQREHQRTAASVFSKRHRSQHAQRRRACGRGGRAQLAASKDACLEKRQPRRSTNHLYRPCQATSGTDPRVVSGRRLIGLGCRLPGSKIQIAFLGGIKRTIPRSRPASGRAPRAGLVQDAACGTGAQRRLVLDETEHNAKLVQGGPPAPSKTAPPNGVLPVIPGERSCCDDHLNPPCEPWSERWITPRGRRAISAMPKASSTSCVASVGPSTSRRCGDCTRRARPQDGESRPRSEYR